MSVPPGVYHPPPPSHPVSCGFSGRMTDPRGAQILNRIQSSSNGFGGLVGEGDGFGVVVVLGRGLVDGRTVGDVAGVIYVARLRSSVLLRVAITSTIPVPKVTTRKRKSSHGVLDPEPVIY